MAHCGKRRYEKRVKSIKDINEDDDVEDVKDDTDDVVEEKQQENGRRKLVEDQVYSSMNADVDVEDIGFDAERIDDVVAAYNAVEDNENHAEDLSHTAQPTASEDGIRDLRIESIGLLRCSLCPPGSYTRL